MERAAVLTDANGRFVVDPSATVGESSSRTGGERLTLQRHWESARDVKIEEGTGAHGGGDALLLADIFRGQEMTGWNDQRIGSTGSARSRSEWQAMNHCARGCRSRSPILALA